MSRNGADVWLEGERELFVNMQKRLDGCTKEARKGLRKAGLQIIADAKENLRGNHSVVTGQLRASGKVQKVEEDPDSIDVGFFSKGGNGYALFVEYGRRAGKMPPVDEIMQWLKKKSSVRSGTKSAMASAAAFMGRKVGDYLRSLAWAIAKAISRRGSSPHPFFGPAVEKNKAAISEAIAEAVNKETKRDGK